MVVTMAVAGAAAATGVPGEEGLYLPMGRLGLRWVLGLGLGLGLGPGLGPGLGLGLGLGLG